MNCYEQGFQDGYNEGYSDGVWARKSDVKVGDELKYDGHKCVATRITHVKEGYMIDVVRDDGKTITIGSAYPNDKKTGVTYPAMAEIIRQLNWKDRRLIEE